MLCSKGNSLKSQTCGQRLAIKYFPIFPKYVDCIK